MLITSQCYVISRLSNNGFRTGELSRRIDNGNGTYFEMPRLWDTKYVNSPAYSVQHNKCGNASLRLVGTRNPQQIEVMEFALIVAENGD